MLLRRISNAHHNTPGKPASLTPILACSRMFTFVIGAIFRRSVIATASAVTCLPSSHPHRFLSLRYESGKGEEEDNVERNCLIVGRKSLIFPRVHASSCAVYKQMSAIYAHGASLFNALNFGHAGKITDWCQTADPKIKKNKVRSHAITLR